MTHKVLHGLLGGAIGYVKGDAIAGAIGGALSETLIELISGDLEELQVKLILQVKKHGLEPGSKKYSEMIEEGVLTSINWATLGTAVVAALGKWNVNISADAATNSLENNFLPCLLLAVQGGMMAYDAYQAYQESGAEGVVESIATDVAMGLLTGGAGKIIAKGGKAVWKTGKNACNQAKQSKNVSALTDPVSSSVAKPSASKSTAEALDWGGVL